MSKELWLDYECWNVESEIHIFVDECEHLIRLYREGEKVADAYCLGSWYGVLEDSDPPPEELDAASIFKVDPEFGSVLTDILLRPPSKSAPLLQSPFDASAWTPGPFTEVVTTLLDETQRRTSSRVTNAKLRLNALMSSAATVQSMAVPQWIVPDSFKLNYSAARFSFHGSLSFVPQKKQKECLFSWHFELDSEKHYICQMLEKMECGDDSWLVDFSFKECAMKEAGVRLLGYQPEVQFHGQWPKAPRMFSYQELADHIAAPSGHALKSFLVAVLEQIRPNKK
jgi:hypothetical protein